MPTAPFDAVPPRQVYLDFNASTPLADAVIAAMQPLLREHFGNPSSLHWAGTPARQIVEDARREVAALLNCGAADVIFTSGGTESNNCAIKGVAFTRGVEGAHIVTTAVEHPAVLEPCRFLERLGATVTRLPVDSTGLVDPDDVRRALTPRTVLVSVMHANNEVGTIQPIEEISRITREHGALLHVDAAQSAGKIDVNVQRLGADLLSVAGHKLYAPKGVGALYVRLGVHLEPLLHGAGHERARRAGTESVMHIAGLGAACGLARRDPCGERLRDMTQYFWTRLQGWFGQDVVLNGHPTRRLPNTLNVSFTGRKGYEVLADLTACGVAASAGSACHAGTSSMSPVLAAMGVPPDIGLGAIRFSLGRPTTRDDLDYVAGELVKLAWRSV
jgi:cysteine desulfurase